MGRNACRRLCAGVAVLPALAPQANLLAKPSSTAQRLHFVQRPGS